LRVETDKLAVDVAKKDPNLISKLKNSKNNSNQLDLKSKK
jgi:hypothetical protein